jgi:hypothetical protein
MIMKFNPTLALAGCFGAALLTSSVAHAWFIPDQFSGPYFRNSGGNHYTGAPRGMYACDGCHVGSEDFPPSERISLAITSQRVNGGALEAYDLFTSGYVPGDRYKIRVELVGEHRGHNMADGSYQDPAGTQWKVDCPKNTGGPFYISQLHNRNQITAEVVNEDGVYADHAGNAAGHLRPDSTAGATAEGACLNTARCTANDPLPPGLEAGGPTSIMARHWVNDPTSNPPLGNWSCGVCDAIASNSHDMLTPATENAAFAPFVTEFFWEAPGTPPATEGGRIRFYIAGVDGDGYADTLDDDFAAAKVAVCPAGASVAECDPMIGPGWGIGAMGAPPPTSRGATASRSGAPAASGVHWVPVALSSLFVLGTVIGLQRQRRGLDLGRLRGA